MQFLVRFLPVMHFFLNSFPDSTLVPLLPGIILHHEGEVPDDRSWKKSLIERVVPAFSDAVSPRIPENRAFIAKPERRRF